MTNKSLNARILVVVPFSPTEKFLLASESHALINYIHLFLLADTST